MGNPVVHFEVTGRDGPGLQDFYGRLFDWTIKTDNPMGYGIVDAGSGPQGGVGGTDGSPGWSTFYVEVEDPGATLAEVERLGGTVRMPVTAVPGGPTMAMFTDPEGNLIGLVQGSA